MKEISDEDIRGFLQTVRDHSIYDFYGYSLSSLRRRLLKITDDFHTDLTGLAGRMRSDPSLLELIVKKITVNTTELFRDPAVWISLKENILPRFRNQDSISVWHPGCSTGQEVYSMMMLLDHMGLLEKSNIYASDINTDVLAAARSGKYKYRFNSDYIRYFNMVFNEGEGNAKNQGKISHARYFVADEAKDLILFKDFLRNKPVYKKLDLVSDDNLFFVNFDLIICRNVIIYFNYDLQNRVFSLFHRSMNEKGVLLLGLHESILGPYASHFLKQDFFYFRKNV